MASRIHLSVKGGGGEGGGWKNPPSPQATGMGPDKFEVANLKAAAVCFTCMLCKVITTHLYISYMNTANSSNNNMYNVRAEVHIYSNKFIFKLSGFMEMCTESLPCCCTRSKTM